MTLSRIKTQHIVIVVLTMITLLIFSPQVLAADLGGAACEGIKVIGGECPAEDDSGNGEIQTIIQKITSVLLFLVGAVSVVMIIIGGLRFIFSNGDPQQAASARNTVLYSIVGVIVAASAYGIINFVIGKF